MIFQALTWAHHQCGDQLPCFLTVAPFVLIRLFLFFFIVRSCLTSIPPASIVLIKSIQRRTANQFAVRQGKQAQHDGEGQREQVGAGKALALQNADGDGREAWATMATQALLRRAVSFLSLLHTRCLGYTRRKQKTELRVDI